MCDVKSLNQSWNYYWQEPSGQNYKREERLYSELQRRGHTYDEIAEARKRLVNAKREFLTDIGWHLYATQFAKRWPEIALSAAG